MMAHTSPITYSTPFLVRSTLKVLCGCGVRYADITEAEEHASRTGHTLVISGEVRAEK